MSEARDLPLDLGPTTERRFAEAFAQAAVITRLAAAQLIGVDVRTIDALSDAGILRAVRRGTLRAYIERDLRAYLVESACECPSTKDQAPPISTSTSSIRVVDFTARPARLRDARRKPSSGRSA